MAGSEERTFASVERYTWRPLEVNGLFLLTTCDIHKTEAENHPHQAPSSNLEAPPVVQAEKGSAESIQTDFIALGKSSAVAGAMADKLWQSVQTNAVRNKNDSCDLIANETQTSVAQANAEGPENEVARLVADVGPFAKAACEAAR